jgi:C1A family cysteine protease
MFKAQPFLTILSLNTYLTADYLKQLLMNGPVSAYIYAETGFLAYSSGVYWCTTTNNASFEKLNHVVNIIGYDNNSNWIIKNSFGPSWGTNGFEILNNITNCGVMAYVYQYTANRSNSYYNYYANTYDYTIRSKFINGITITTKKNELSLKIIKLWTLFIFALLAF